jgi:hypothetical protein
MKLISFLLKISKATIKIQPFCQLKLTKSELCRFYQTSARKLTWHNLYLSFYTQCVYYFIPKCIISNSISNILIIWDWRLTGDGFPAAGAPLGEEFSKALGAIGFLVARSEALSGQGSVAVGASEALTMPRLVLVSHTASGDDLQVDRRHISTCKTNMHGFSF